VNDPNGPAVPTLATAARWGARVLSVLILLFWGFFIVAHLFGEEQAVPQPLPFSDYIVLTTMGVTLIGLVVAWKWEFVGGAMTLGAIMITALVNWRVLLFPFVLLPVTAVLFLSSWWMRKPPTRDKAMPRSIG
jgi:fucose 4-O-acetylase-like acetyltransferase